MKGWGEEGWREETRSWDIIRINTMIKYPGIRIILTKGTLKEQPEKLREREIHEALGRK